LNPHEKPGKAFRVRRMFNAIAPTYELINTLFSVGRDAAWRRRAVELAEVRRDDTVLDVACGTGDFARAFARAQPRLVVGCDFAGEMLERARTRWVHDSLPEHSHGSHCPMRWCEADGLRLPFRSESFTIVSCAFGVRNFEDLDAGLREMVRVLKPGGRAVILEFTRPPNHLFRAIFEFYSTRVMPQAAALASGDRSGAYRYLPRSVISFLDAEQMRVTLRKVGFARSTATLLTMGVVTVYSAERD
jgi:demethylmenaquinone methyltransferase/2-methoxy-6-polyprenyl-1,4-benzoquinol methylase